MGEMEGKLSALRAQLDKQTAELEQQKLLAEDRAEKLLALEERTAMLAKERGEAELHLKEANQAHEDFAQSHLTLTERIKAREEELQKSVTDLKEDNKDLQIKADVQKNLGAQFEKMEKALEVKLEDMKKQMEVKAKEQAKKERAEEERQTHAKEEQRLEFEKLSAKLQEFKPQLDHTESNVNKKLKQELDKRFAQQMKEIDKDLKVNLGSMAGSMNENFKGLYQGLQGLGRSDKKGVQAEEEIDFDKLVKADKDIPKALKVYVYHKLEAHAKKEKEASAGRQLKPSDKERIYHYICAELIAVYNLQLLGPSIGSPWLGDTIDSEWLTARDFYAGSRVDSLLVGREQLRPKPSRALVDFAVGKVMEDMTRLKGDKETDEPGGATDDIGGGVDGDEGKKRWRIAMKNAGGAGVLAARFKGKLIPPTRDKGSNKSTRRVVILMQPRWEQTNQQLIEGFYQKKDKLDKADKQVRGVKLDADKDIQQGAEEKQGVEEKQGTELAQKNAAFEMMESVSGVSRRYAGSSEEEKRQMQDYIQALTKIYPGATLPTFGVDLEQLVHDSLQPPANSGHRLPIINVAKLLEAREATLKELPVDGKVGRPMAKTASQKERRRTNLERAQYRARDADLVLKAKQADEQRYTRTNRLAREEVEAKAEGGAKEERKCGRWKNSSVEKQTALAMDLAKAEGKKMRRAGRAVAFGTAHLDDQLLTDHDVVHTLMERLAETDCEQGFVLTGFPRTVLQAKTFDRIMKQSGEEVWKVLAVVAPQEPTRAARRPKRVMQHYFDHIMPIVGYYETHSAQVLSTVDAGQGPTGMTASVEIAVSTPSQPELHFMSEIFDETMLTISEQQKERDAERRQAAGGDKANKIVMSEKELLLSLDASLAPYTKVVDERVKARCLATSDNNSLRAAKKLKSAMVLTPDPKLALEAGLIDFVPGNPAMHPRQPSIRDAKLRQSPFEFFKASREQQATKLADEQLRSFEARGMVEEVLQLMPVATAGAAPSTNIQKAEAGEGGNVQTGPAHSNHIVASMKLHSLLVSHFLLRPESEVANWIPLYNPHHRLHCNSTVTVAVPGDFDGEPGRQVKVIDGDGKPIPGIYGMSLPRDNVGCVGQRWRFVSSAQSLQAADGSSWTVEIPSGKWYGATIISTNEGGSCDVEYDDGSGTQSSVPTRQIRRKGSIPTDALTVGDEVEVRYGGLDPGSTFTVQVPGKQCGKNCSCGMRFWEMSRDGGEARDGNRSFEWEESQKHRFRWQAKQEQADQERKEEADDTEPQWAVTESRFDQRTGAERKDPWDPLGWKSADERAAWDRQWGAQRYTPLSVEEQWEKLSKAEQSEFHGKHCGKLVLDGGGAGAGLHKRIVDLAGGKDNAVIGCVFLTACSIHHKKVEAESNWTDTWFSKWNAAVKGFRAAGLPMSRLLLIPITVDNSQERDKEEYIDIVRRCTVIWMPGDSTDPPQQARSVQRAKKASAAKGAEVHAAETGISRMMRLCFKFNTRTSRGDPSGLFNAIQDRFKAGAVVGSTGSTTLAATWGAMLTGGSNVYQAVLKGARVDQRGCKPELTYDANGGLGLLHSQGMSYYKLTHPEEQVESQAESQAGCLATVSIAPEGLSGGAWRGSTPVETWSGALVDVECAEKGRLLRLLRLIYDVRYAEDAEGAGTASLDNEDGSMKGVKLSTPYGIGIGAEAQLILDCGTGIAEVAGTSTVQLVDCTEPFANGSMASSRRGATFAVEGVKLHVLSLGDKLNMRTGEITFAPSKEKVLSEKEQKECEMTLDQEKGKEQEQEMAQEMAWGGQLGDTSSPASRDASGSVLRQKKWHLRSAGSLLGATVPAQLDVPRGAFASAVTSAAQQGGQEEAKLFVSSDICQSIQSTSRAQLERAALSLFNSSKYSAESTTIESEPRYFVRLSKNGYFNEGPRGDAAGTSEASSEAAVCYRSTWYRTSSAPISIRGLRLSMATTSAPTVVKVKRVKALGKFAMANSGLKNHAFSKSPQALAAAESPEEEVADQSYETPPAQPEPIDVFFKRFDIRLVKRYHFSDQYTDQYVVVMYESGKEQGAQGNSKKPWLQSRVSLGAGSMLVNLREASLDVNLVPADKTTGLDIEMAKMAAKKYELVKAREKGSVLEKKGTVVGALEKLHRVAKSISEHSTHKGVYGKVEAHIDKEEKVASRALEAMLNKSRTMDKIYETAMEEKRNKEEAAFARKTQSKLTKKGRSRMSWHSKDKNTSPPLQQSTIQEEGEQIDDPPIDKAAGAAANAVQGSSGASKDAKTSWRYSTSKKSKAKNKVAPSRILSQSKAGRKGSEQEGGDKKEGTSSEAKQAGGAQHSNGNLRAEPKVPLGKADGEEGGQATLKTNDWGIASAAQPGFAVAAKEKPAAKAAVVKGRELPLSCFTPEEEVELEKEKRRLESLHQSEKLIRGEYDDGHENADIGNVGLECDFVDQWVAVADELKGALFGTASTSGYLKDEHPFGGRRLDEYKTMTGTLADRLHDGDRLCVLQNIDPKLAVGGARLLSVGDLAALHGYSGLGDGQASLQLLPGGGVWCTPLVDAHNPQKHFMLRMLRRMCAEYSRTKQPSSMYGIGIGTGAELILDLETKIATVHGPEIASKTGAPTVLLLDISKAQFHEGCTFSVQGALFHTLTHGDCLNMETGEILFPDWKCEDVGVSEEVFDDDEAVDKMEAKAGRAAKMVMGRRMSVEVMGGLEKGDEYRLETAALGLFPTSRYGPGTAEHDLSTGGRVLRLKTQQNEELQYQVVMSTKTPGAEAYAGQEKAKEGEGYTTGEEGLVDEGRTVFKSFKGVTVDVLPAERRITILAGPPGSGKSTHGPSIAEELNTPYVTMAEVLMGAVAKVQQMAQKGNQGLALAGDAIDKATGAAANAVHGSSDSKGTKTWLRSKSKAKVTDTVETGVVGLAALASPRDGVKHTVLADKNKKLTDKELREKIAAEARKVTDCGGWEDGDEHFKGPVTTKKLVAAKQAMDGDGLIDDADVAAILEYELHWGRFIDTANRTKEAYALEKAKFKQPQSARTQVVRGPSVEEAASLKRKKIEEEEAGAGGEAAAAGEAAGGEASAVTGASVHEVIVGGRGRSTTMTADGKMVTSEDQEDGTLVTVVESDEVQPEVDELPVESSIAVTHAAAVAAAAALDAHKAARQEWKHGYVLDGYPKTEEQAKDYNRILAWNREHIWKVVYLSITEATCRDRLCGDWDHASGSIYHVDSSDPKGTPPDVPGDMLHRVYIERTQQEGELVKGVKQEKGLEAATYEVVALSSTKPNDRCTDGWCRTVAAAPGGLGTMTKEYVLKNTDGRKSVGVPDGINAAAGGAGVGRTAFGRYGPRPPSTTMKACIFEASELRLIKAPLSWAKHCSEVKYNDEYDEGKETHATLVVPTKRIHAGQQYKVQVKPSIDLALPPSASASPAPASPECVREPGKLVKRQPAGGSHRKGGTVGIGMALSGVAPAPYLGGGADAGVDALAGADAALTPGAEETPAVGVTTDDVLAVDGAATAPSSHALKDGTGESDSPNAPEEHAVDGNVLHFTYAEVGHTHTPPAVMSNAHKMLDDDDKMVEGGQGHRLLAPRGDYKTHLNKNRDKVYKKDDGTFKTLKKKHEMFDERWKNYQLRAPGVAQKVFGNDWRELKDEPQVHVVQVQKGKRKYDVHKDIIQILSTGVEDDIEHRRGNLDEYLKAEIEVGDETLDKYRVVLSCSKKRSDTFGGDVDSIMRRVVKRQIHFLSLLVRKMMVQYLQVNSGYWAQQNKGATQETFSEEQLSAMGDLLQDRIVMRLSDRVLEATLKGVEGKEGNKKSCTVIFPRAKLIIDKLFEFTIPDLNLSQPRPINNYGRVVKTVDSLLNHSMYNRLISTLARATGRKIKLKSLSLVGTRASNGEVVRDCTVSKLPLWFKIKMLRYRGELAHIEETKYPLAIIRDPAKPASNGVSAILHDYPREHFVDLTPSFRVMEALDKSTEYKIKMQTTNAILQAMPGRYLELTFGVDDLICMVDEWVGQRCSRIVEKLKKERREEGNGDDEAAAGGEAEKTTNGDQPEAEGNVDDEEEEEQVQGLLDREFYAILGQLNLSRVCEQINTSLLVSASVKEKKKKKKKKEEEKGKVEKMLSLVGKESDEEKHKWSLLNKYCEPLWRCWRPEGHDYYNKVMPQQDTPDDSSLEMQIRPAHRSRSRESVERTLKYGESSCLGLVNRMLEVHDKNDKADDSYLFGEVHEMIFVLLRPIYDDEPLQELFDEWAKHNSTNELRLLKIRKQLEKKKRAERKKLLAEQGVQNKETRKERSISRRVKNLIRRKKEEQEQVRVFIVDGKYRQRGNPARLSARHTFKRGVIRQKRSAMEQSIPAAIVDGQLVEHLHFEVFIDGSDSKQIDEEGVEYERYALILGRDLALDVELIEVPASVIHAVEQKYLAKLEHQRGAKMQAQAARTKAAVAHWGEIVVDETHVTEYKNQRLARGYIKKGVARSVPAKGGDKGAASKKRNPKKQSASGFVFEDKLYDVYFDRYGLAKIHGRQLMVRTTPHMQHSLTSIIPYVLSHASCTLSACPRFKAKRLGLTSTKKYVIMPRVSKSVWRWGW
jgi:adenylate kinase family enzyme